MTLNLKRLHKMLIFGLALVAVPSLAQETKTQEQTQPAPKTQDVIDIPSIDRIPSAVEAKMPRDGTTLFYGAVPKIGPQKQDVLIHLYSVPVKDVQILARNRSAVNCTVNLFSHQGSNKNSKRSKKFQLLNTMHFYSWSKMVDEGRDVKANLLWLVPTTKQTPVLNFIFDGSAGAMYGFWRHNAILVFNRGLQRPPVEATFFSGSFSESSNSYSFETLDTQGRMAISTYSSQRVVDQGADESHGELRWNGNGFG